MYSQGLLARRSRGEMIMKAILTAAFLALSVLAGSSLSASAAEYDYPTNIFDQIQRHLP